MDFETLEADFASEPITGWLHTGERIHVPLISHIVDNLYVGGHSESANLGDFFSHVFSLYHFPNALGAPGPYKFDKGTVFEGYTLYDSPGAHENHDLSTFVGNIVDALNEGGNVLVHCQAGINRSNLVAALVLRKWKGLTSREAIDLLREKRSRLILANWSFENYLLGLDD